ncbi:integrase [Pseudonocardiaceae bacterium YIM PH 21723]|nr:integrase [Pseudonocardiaceae bacterium YIM PH 21723]
MEMTYDVKIWAIRAYVGTRKSTYRVRWLVAGEEWGETFDASLLAESFRSDLVSAQRKGQAFVVATGLPVTMNRAAKEVSWFQFACKYVDMKWPRAAAKSRVGIADSLATITPMMLATERGAPDAALLRKALTGWAFNKKRREDPQPPEIENALKWVARNTRQLSYLKDESALRLALEQLSLKLDGTQAAAKTVNRKRAVFYNLLDYAVECEALDANRLGLVKWTAPKAATAIDKRVVINPDQAIKLLDAVQAQHVEGQPRRSSGPALKAYFAVLYYAGLRPEEAAMLRKEDLQLPEKGWGELLLSETAPIVGSAWTDSGKRRDRRQLKQRAKGQIRPVPSSPPLTRILHEHLARFGTAADGRLFRSLTGGDLSESTVGRVWDNARKAALSEQEYASVLGRRPYDLRHACVSTQLAAGVQSAQVAEWAGHSVAVLHREYAQVIAGLESSARERIEQALGVEPDDG